MAIKKMNLVSIVGPVEEFDDVIQNHLGDKKIFLENALNVLDNARELKPFDSINPYSERYKHFLSLADGFEFAECEKTSVSNDVVKEFVAKLEDKKQKRDDDIERFKAAIENNKDVINQLVPIISLDMDLNTICSFEFIKIRFGKMPKDSYKKLNTYLDELETVFIYGQEDKDYVWGMYFVLESNREKIDRVFSSLYFEPISIKGKWNGTPYQVKKQLDAENEQYEEEIESCISKYNEFLKGSAHELNACYTFLKKNNAAYNFKHYGAHTDSSFYTVGWTDKKTLKILENEFADMPQIVVIAEDAHEAPKHITPPTLLVNNPIFRPFEFFVKMYGLPSYNEIDPTPIVALTYILMFGIMFGDAGQGLLLAIVGFLLYKIKKIDLAAIIGMVGVSSTVFGLLYGSVFGFENVLHKTVVIRPMENIMTMLISSVAFGVVIIFMAMLINILNAIKQKDFGKFLFGQNGLAGFIFYFAVIFGIIMLLLKRNVFTVVYNIIFIAVPLVIIMFQQPLSRLIAKKKKLFDGSKGEFILENLFEVFDIVLSFITNTISFVRVGAFALNHVGMMSVVFIFSNMASGFSSTIVIILGNILVMGLEGLIVGIQVLRLEFYEIFSRFYNGEGREFKVSSELYE